MKKRMSKKRKIVEEEGETGCFPDNDDIQEDVKSDILSRLPPKTLTQFKTTCKQWLSLISTPQFAQLHLNNYATTCSFFVYARNTRTSQQYLLTTTRPDGGPLNHILAINGVSSSRMNNTQTVHLNGLVLHTSKNFSYIVNPTTRKHFQLPFPPGPNNVNIETIHTYNFFGFDQSQNQHKILHMRVLRSLIPSVGKVITTEFEVFSMSDNSWRKLALPPVDVIDLIAVYPFLKQSVCVNSVIHVMFPYRVDKVLAFDLFTERFSVINLPVPLPPQPYTTYYSSRRDGKQFKFNHRFFTQIDGGLLGVVCDDR
uniref:putative F-box protein At1g53370 n=1 Tax=Erigeron canadensis TaxID=72917 RepID=UPI001CB8BD2D|nr:putative F-box protein At1g53370 [Erigeron canadensis]